MIKIHAASIASVYFKVLSRVAVANGNLESKHSEEYLIRLHHRENGKRSLTELFPN